METLEQPATSAAGDIDVQLEHARSTRESGNIEFATAIVEHLFVRYPGHPNVCIERMLLALETLQDGVAVDSLISAAANIGTEASAALALAATHFFNRAYRPAYVHLGNLPNFFAPRWLNVCPIRSAANPTPLAFKSNLVLPVDNATVETVYSSNAIGSKTSDVDERFYHEVRRCLHDRGYFILALGDEVCAQRADKIFSDLGHWDFERLPADVSKIIHRFSHLPLIRTTIDEKTRLSVWTKR